MSDKSVDELVKVANRINSLYLNGDRSVFLVNFNKFERMVKLNTKIRETFTERKDIARVYAAISFFDEVSKKQSFDKAYEIASKHYTVPEKFLRSIVGSRNANKRNSLKA